MDTRTPLISVDELAQTRPDTHLVVDCRFALNDPEQGRRDYLTGHIPGAVYADLNRDLSDLRKQGVGRHPLPEIDDLAETLGRWGWREGMTVIAYDAGSGAMAAARLWWLMRWVGIPTRVLDGGLTAWEAAGQPLESGAVKRDPTRIKLQADPAQVLFTERTRELLAKDDILLLDARAAPRYRGEAEPIDAVAGHVPGARNRPFAGNIEDGQWRSPEALRSEFLQLIGHRDPASIVHMCGSGVTACHNLLAMEHAGLHGSRLYAPSWSGWIADSGNPVEIGEGRETRGE
ncbi:MAG TPA: sulfurtransferase [Rhodanobacteraceae bacterium]|nr:sulfurtransferase [Rhodanobacteraceae bacterium]